MDQVNLGLNLYTNKADAQMELTAKKGRDLFEKKGFNLNLKGGSLPLGRITGDFDKFSGSLDAATARVLAFTATTTVVYGLATAFNRLFTDSIKLEKQLAGIQSILQTSNSNLQKFSSELFKVANATGQSFDVAASAASEFARQGLSVEETLKATNAALAFSKIAGTDAAQTVENLTAALNTFADEALTFENVLDTIVSLDNAFAISAAGISDGLKRVGSVASESGIQLKEIASLIAVVQQVSARGAPVISNGLKTIFTRLSRTSVQEVLNSIGIATQNSNGEFRSQIEVLTDLSNRLDTLSDSQRAFVLEQVAGVYQINTLQATLKSLSGEYSLFDKAVKVASDSSGNAAERLKILTNTTDANLQKLKNNLTQFLAETGKVTVKPILDSFVGIGNKILDTLNLGAAADGGEKAGFSIGKVLLNGISSALAGPGAALLLVTIGRLLFKITKDALVAVQTLSGLKKASLVDEKAQMAVNQAIAMGNKSLVRRLETTTSIVEKTQILQDLMSNMSRSQGMAQINQAVSVGLAANKRGSNKAKGHIPTYAKGFIPDSMQRLEKKDAMAGGYSPKKVIAAPDSIGGVMNKAESLVSMRGMKQPFINPPKNSKAGRKHRKKAIKQTGVDPYALMSAGGFIPNFASPKFVSKTADELSGKGSKKVLERADPKDSFNANIIPVEMPFDVKQIRDEADKELKAIYVSVKGRKVGEKSYNPQNLAIFEEKYKDTANKSLLDRTSTFIKNIGTKGNTLGANASGYIEALNQIQGLIGEAKAKDFISKRNSGTTKFTEGFSPFDLITTDIAGKESYLEVRARQKINSLDILKKAVNQRLKQVSYKKNGNLTDLVPLGDFETVIPKGSAFNSSGFIPNFASRYTESRKQKRDQLRASLFNIGDFAGGAIKNVNAQTEFNQARGKNPNVEFDDKINQVGFKVERIPILDREFEDALRSKENNKEVTTKFENYAIDYLNGKGYSFEAGRNTLYGKENAAVDGYNIKQNFIELLEVKGGKWDSPDVNNKFGRFVPENLVDLGPQLVSKFFKEGNPDPNINDKIRIRNVLAIPNLTGGVFKNNIAPQYPSANVEQIEKARQRTRPSGKKTPANMAWMLGVVKQMQESGATNASGFVPNFVNPGEKAVFPRTFDASTGTFKSPSGVSNIATLLNLLGAFTGDATLGNVLNGFETEMVVKTIMGSSQFLAAYAGEKGAGNLVGDAGKYGLKVTNSLQDRLRKIRKKISFGGGRTRKTSAEGFVPNFASRLSYKETQNAKKKSRAEEAKAGIPVGKIRMGRNPSLRTPYNPEGLGTYNSYEGTLANGIGLAKKQGIDPRSKGMFASKGFIPNFAKNEDEKNILDNINISDTLDSIITLQQSWEDYQKGAESSGVLSPPSNSTSSTSQGNSDALLSSSMKPEQYFDLAVSGATSTTSAQIPSAQNTFQSSPPKRSADERARVQEKWNQSKASKTGFRAMASPANRTSSIASEDSSTLSWTPMQTGMSSNLDEEIAARQKFNEERIERLNKQEDEIIKNNLQPESTSQPKEPVDRPKTPEEIKRERKEEKKKARAERSSSIAAKTTGLAFTASTLTGMLSTPKEGQEQTKTQKGIESIGESIAAGASAAMFVSMVPALAPLAPIVGVAAAGFNYFTKAAKAAVPSTLELTKNNEQLIQSTESQITSLQEAVKAQNEVSQLTSSGGDPRKIAQAQAKFAKSLGGIKDPELVSTIVNEKSDVKKQEAIANFQEKKTKEVNFSQGNLVTAEIIKKSREENASVFGNKTKTSDFKTQDWDTFLNPIIDSIDFTKVKSKEASAAIDQLGNGTLSMGDFIAQFGSELGLTESQVKMASKTYGDLNKEFTSSSIQNMDKYAAALLTFNKNINDTAQAGIKGFSLDFQKVFDEGLKGLTLDTALINYKKFSTAGTNLSIEKSRLDSDRSSGAITEAQGINRQASLQTKELNLETEKKGTDIVSKAVDQLTALIPKDTSIEQRSNILNQATSVLKGGGDLSSLEGLIKQTLGQSDGSKEILSQIADINQEVVLGIEKLRIDQADGVRSINTIAQDQLKESQKRSVAEIGRAALAGPPKYTNKLMNTGAVMETDAKIQKLRDKAEKSGGAKSAEGRKLLLEASNLEMQNDRVKYEDELAQAERYGKDNVVKRTTEGKSGAAQIQRNMAEDIGNKLRGLNASREKSGKTGIFSNEDIKKISEGIQIGGEGATESRRLLEEKLNNPNYAQDATVQGFAREIKDVGGANSIFANNKEMAASSGANVSISSGAGVAGAGFPAVPSTAGGGVPTVPSATGAGVPTIPSAAGAGVPTVPSTAGTGVPTVPSGGVPATDTSMNPSSAALPNYASSTANITAKSLTGRGSEQADILRRSAAVTQTEDYKSFEAEKAKNARLRQERSIAQAAEPERIKSNLEAAAKIADPKTITRTIRGQNTSETNSAGSSGKYRFGGDTGGGSIRGMDIQQEVIIQDLVDFQKRIKEDLTNITETDFENLKASTLKDSEGNDRSREEITARNAYISQVEKSGFSFKEDEQSVEKRIQQAQAEKEAKAKQGLDTTLEDTKISNLTKRKQSAGRDFDKEIERSDTTLSAKRERVDAAISAAESYNTQSSRFLTQDAVLPTKTKSKTAEETDRNVKKLQNLEETAKILGDGKKEDERVKRVQQELKEGKEVVGKDGKIERVKMSPEQVKIAQEQLAVFEKDRTTNANARKVNQKERAQVKADLAQDPVQYLKSLEKQRGTAPLEDTTQIDENIKKSQDYLKNGVMRKGKDGKEQLTQLSPEDKAKEEASLKANLAAKKEMEARNQSSVDLDNKIKATTAQAQVADPKGYLELLQSRRGVGPPRDPEALKKGIQDKKDRIKSLEKVNPLSTDEANQFASFEKETKAYDKSVSNVKELEALNKMPNLSEQSQKRKAELEATSSADMQLIEGTSLKDIQDKKKKLAGFKERIDPKGKIAGLKKEIETDEKTLSEDQLIAEAQKKADAKDPAKVRASYVAKLKGSKDKNLNSIAGKIERLDKNKNELESLKGKTLTGDDKEELTGLENEVRSFDKAESNRKELDILRAKEPYGTLTEEDQKRKKELEGTAATDAETLKKVITPEKTARIKELQGKAKNSEREAQLKNEVKKGTEDVARATDQNMGAINNELFKGQVAPVIMDQIQKPEDKKKVEAYNAKVVERQDQEAQLDPLNKNIADIEAKRRDRSKVGFEAMAAMGEDKDGKKSDYIQKFIRGEVTAEEADQETGGALKNAYNKVIPKKEGQTFEDLNNVGNIKDEKGKKAQIEKQIAQTKEEENKLGAVIKPLVDAVTGLTNAQGAATEGGAEAQNAQGAQGVVNTTNVNTTSQISVNITGEGITPEMIEKLRPSIIGVVEQHNREVASAAGKPPPAAPPPKSPPVTTP